MFGLSEGRTTSGSGTCPGRCVFMVCGANGGRFVGGALDNSRCRFHVSPVLIRGGHMEYSAVRRAGRTAGLVVTTAAILASYACRMHRNDSVSPVDTSVITESEIDSVHAFNAFDAVYRLRPRFLTSRGKVSLDPRSSSTTSARRSTSSATETWPASSGSRQSTDAVLRTVRNRWLAAATSRPDSLDACPPARTSHGY